MKKIIFISLSMLFSGEMEVDGDLNVSGDIQSPTIEELQAQILALQSQSSGVIPYEPYNLIETMAVYNVGTNNDVFYNQFHSPSTGQYYHIRLFITRSLPENDSFQGTIGAAIYSDTPGQPGSPSNLLGSGHVMLIGDVDRKYIDIPLDTPVNLVANTRYWVAFGGSADTPGSIFQIGLNPDYYTPHNLVRKGVGYFEGAFPTDAGSSLDNINYPAYHAFWFRIY